MLRVDPRNIMHGIVVSNLKDDDGWNTDMHKISIDESCIARSYTDGRLMSYSPDGYYYLTRRGWEQLKDQLIPQNHHDYERWPLYRDGIYHRNYESYIDGLLDCCLGRINRELKRSSKNTISMYGALLNYMPIENNRWQRFKIKVRLWILNSILGKENG